MSKPNKYPARPQTATSVAATQPAVSIADALGPDNDEFEVEVEASPDAPEEAASDPLDDVRGPELEEAPAAPAPALRSFMALADCTFSINGHGLAVRAGKVYTEERYGALAADQMARSKAFSLVGS